MGGDRNRLGFSGLRRGLFHGFMEQPELVGRTRFPGGAEAPGQEQADLFAQPLDLGLILGLLFLQRLLPVLLLFLFPPGKVCCLAQDQSLQGGHILGDFGDAWHMVMYTQKHRNRLLFLVIKAYNTEE